MSMTNPPIASMIAEIEQEEAATQRLLERVPEDKLDWRPHPRSMTLGELAHHVAGCMGDVGQFLEMDGFDLDGADFKPTQPESLTEIHEKLRTAQAAAREQLGGLAEGDASAPWTLRKGDAEIFTIPKAWLARTLMLNHLYHHRGQLSVYLRLLDIPVPATYGQSADESLFD